MEATARASKTKTTAERVHDLRQRRADLGLVRLDIYAHPLDHAALKRYAGHLTEERKAKPKKKASIYQASNADGKVLTEEQAQLINRMLYRGWLKTKRELEDTDFPNVVAWLTEDLAAFEAGSVILGRTETHAERDAAAIKWHADRDAKTAANA